MLKTQNKLIQISLAIFLPLFIGVILLLCYTQSLHEYSDFRLKYPQGYSKSVPIPHQGHRHLAGVYTYEGTLSPSSWASLELQIIPDDEVLEIQVDGKRLPLQDKISGSLSDYKEGFVYDFSPYLTQESHQVKIKVKQIGQGIMGLKVVQPAQAIFIPLATAFVTLTLGFWCYLLTGSWVFTGLFALGIALRMVYFGVTPPDVRGHDLGDHYGYVIYMAEHWLPPTIDKAMGGAFFHPPLYYYLGAITHQISLIFSPNGALSQLALQVLSFLLSGVYLAFGLKTIQFVFSQVFQPKDSTRDHFHQFVFVAVGLIFVTWPSAIIHSVRIGNDPLIYALFAISLYYIVHWYRQGEVKSIFWASLFGGLCTLAKANGIILLAVLGSLLLINALRKRQVFKHMMMLKWPLLFFGFSLCVTFAPGAILKLQGKRETLYVDNINNVSQALRVGNTPKNYLYFDLETFLVEPFTSPWDDQLGRQYYANYLGKTGLFGEFNYHQTLSRHMAEVISFLSVLLVIICMMGIYRTKPKEWLRHTPLSLSFFFLMAGVIYMRATFPVNIDFRYVLPILIPFCSFVGVSTLYFHQQGLTKWRTLSMVIMVLFSMSSALFILGLQL